MQSGWGQFGVQQDYNEYINSGVEVEYCVFNISDEASQDQADEGEFRCDFYNVRTDDGDDGEGGSGGEEEDENDDDEIIRTSSRGGGSTGTRVRQAAPRPLVAGAATTNFCPFLEDYMQIGAENDTMEVMKLQLFLNIFKDMYGGVENPLTGNFGSITDANVKAFQETYRSEVLDPWFDRGIVPHDRPTGFVYKTTLWKINSIICPDYVNELDFTGESLDSNVDNNQNAIVRD
jgi:peptidoglycan hydrolase-like protein with peptidoglycan-binding domain